MEYAHAISQHTILQVPYFLAYRTLLNKLHTLSQDEETHVFSSHG